MTIALHSDCVCCRARENEAAGRFLSAEDATVVILAVLRSGVSAEQVHRDLCFQHRRQVEDASRGV